MKQIAIRCDGCGKDITYTSEPEEFRLKLVSEWIPVYPAITDAVEVRSGDYVAEDMHFCNIGCIKKWAKNEPSQD